MNASHTTILATICVAAALTASAAWADTGVEDHHAAVSAAVSSDEQRIQIVVINSHMPADNPRLNMDTVKGYDISQSGRLNPFDVKTVRTNSPWGLGSTTVVVGDTVYKVTALHGEPPRVEDVGIRVGIVWEGGLPYALTFSQEAGLDGTAWNVTGGMFPVEHSYGLVDAEWGPFPGYTHVYLNDTRYAVVLAIYDNVKFPNRPPETTGNISYNEPFERPVLVRIGNHDAGEVDRLSAAGNGERLIVEQGRIVPSTTYGTEGGSLYPVVFELNTYHFYDLDGGPVASNLSIYEESRPAYFPQDDRMVIMSIDGEKYAVVATVDGPPALVDAAGAAALGMGDIRYMTPKDYIRWDIPDDAPPTEGTIMEVTGLRSAHGGGDRTFFEFKVRNVYHEPLSIYIDRAAAAGHSLHHADVVVEQSHPYSGFDAPLGAIRLSGEFLGGHFGPSKAYLAADIPYERPLGYGNYDTGVHRGINTVYSNEKLGRVFAYVETRSSIWLEPGQSMRTGITLFSPCLYREESSIWTDGACGIGGPSLDKYNLEFDHVGLVLVAAGHPEWAVATYVEQACDRWGCEAEAVTTHVVHIDDVCEGARCDSLP